MTELGKQIITLREQGMTYSQIIAKTGAAKSTVAYYCGVGVKEKSMVRQRSKRNKIRSYVQKVKQQSPCVDCGENYPYWMMDFDHVHSDKFFNIAAYQAYTDSIDRVKEEISKCDLVCANCHRNRTHFRLVKNGSDVLDISEHYQ